MYERKHLHGVNTRPGPVSICEPNIIPERWDFEMPCTTKGKGIRVCERVGVTDAVVAKAARGR